jgi:hypothetical protein
MPTPRRPIRDRLEDSGIMSPRRGGHGAGDPRTPDFFQYVEDSIRSEPDAFRAGLDMAESLILGPRTGRPARREPAPAQPQRTPIPTVARRQYPTSEVVLSRAQVENMPNSVLSALRIVEENIVGDVVRVEMPAPPVLPELTPTSQSGESPGLTLDHLRQTMRDMMLVPDVQRVTPRPGVRLNSDFIIPADIWDRIPQGERDALIRIQQARGNGSTETVDAAALDAVPDPDVVVIPAAATEEIYRGRGGGRGVGGRLRGAEATGVWIDEAGVFASGRYQIPPRFRPEVASVRVDESDYLRHVVSDAANASGMEPEDL